MIGTFFTTTMYGLITKGVALLHESIRNTSSIQYITTIVQYRNVPTKCIEYIRQDIETGTIEEPKEPNNDN